ncbi:MAG: SulP family inorganic anion transporter [Desulfobulbaceae bacterium]|nr:SulP family inorganic anion transporter [Desulfobulbaceae bacterium]
MNTSFRFFERFLPFIAWLRGYDRHHLRADLFAGLTVALVLIPQSMAYAQLAGLPTHYGLYAALLPPVVGALFGSSRQLATGPVAVISLMIAASLEPMATAGSDGYIAYAILLAFIVGLFQFLLGALRLGLVVNFLSHPVVHGFTNAAAVIIAVSQLPKLFGVTVDGGGNPLATIPPLLQAVARHGHWPTLAMALLAFSVMAGGKRFNAKLPNVLLAVAITTLLSWTAGFERQQRLDLTELAAPKATALIADLNSTLAEIDKSTGERALLTARLHGLEKRSQPGEAMLVLELRHRRERLELEIEQAKKRVRQRQGDLRAMEFVTLEGEDGILFLERLAAEAASVAQGRIWRLKVGNTPLALDGLTMVSGGAVVGAIPQGLPAFRLPQLDFKVFWQLLPCAMIISLLGFMEAISIARAMASKTGQKLDANQELIGQGLANMVGALGGSYPVSGSFSRSAVTLQAGGVSGLANVLSALFVVLTLLVLTPLLYHLPQAVLAVIIIMAVTGLMNLHGFAHAWKAQKSDGVIAVATFVSTLALAPHLDMGIGLGVLLSIVVFLYKKMRPKVATLAMNADKVLQCSEEHRLQLCPHIAAVRFDGTLFFANAGYLDEQIFRIRSANPDLRYILLVADGINDIDSSGEETLALMIERVRHAGLGFAMCRVKENVLAVLRRTGLLERLGTDNIYPSEESALEKIIRETHRPQPDGQQGCQECPLLHHLPRQTSGGEDNGPDGIFKQVVRARNITHQVAGSMAASR